MSSNNSINKDLIAFYSYKKHNLEILPELEFLVKKKSNHNKHTKYSNFNTKYKNSNIPSNFI